MFYHAYLTTDKITVAHISTNFHVTKDILTAEIIKMLQIVVKHEAPIGTLVQVSSSHLFQYSL